MLKYWFSIDFLNSRSKIQIFFFPICTILASNLVFLPLSVTHFQPKSSGDFSRFFPIFSVFLLTTLIYWIHHRFYWFDFLKIPFSTKYLFFPKIARKFAIRWVSPSASLPETSLSPLSHCLPSLRSVHSLAALLTFFRRSSWSLEQNWGQLAKQFSDFFWFKVSFFSFLFRTTGK